MEKRFAYGANIKKRLYFYAVSTNFSGSDTAYSAKKAVLTLIEGLNLNTNALSRELGVNWRTAEKIRKGKLALTLDQVETLLEKQGLALLIVSKECLIR